MQKRKYIAGLCALFMACSAGAVSVPVHATTAENSVSSSAQTDADAVVTLINQERTAQGLKPLKAVPVLNQTAEIRSQELVTVFSHTRPDGRSYSTVLDDAGISWRTTGENIAYGYSSPEAVMKGWMNSSGHRANILNADFDSVGVGVVSQNGVLYWTQIFTGGAEYSDTYQPEIVPEITVTVPETKEDSPAPSGICIGDFCFDCTGTDCTNPQNLLECLTGNCSDGNCNTQDVLSCIIGNCTAGNCNTLQGLLQNFCK